MNQFSLAKTNKTDYLSLYPLSFLVISFRDLSKNKTATLLFWLLNFIFRSLAYCLHKQGVTGLSVIKTEHRRSDRFSLAGNKNVCL